MRSFVVYAPTGLYYPWHHHPAEELYLVLAGEAEFSIHGQTPKTLRPGDTTYHASMKPHAMTTHDHPVMAYVLWRSNLMDPPCSPLLKWPPEPAFWLGGENGKNPARREIFVAFLEYFITVVKQDARCVIYTLVF